MSSDALSESEIPPGPARDLVDLYRELRSGRSLTYGQITAKTGLSKSHISEVLTGRKAPSPDAAQAIAEALGADTDTARRARLYAEQLAELNRFQRRSTAPRHGQSAESAVVPPPTGGTLSIHQSGDGQLINNTGVVLGNVSIHVVQAGGVGAAFTSVLRWFARLRLRWRILVIATAALMTLVSVVSGVVVLGNGSPTGRPDTHTTSPADARPAPDAGSATGTPQASAFVPFGKDRTTFDMSASGTQVTIRAPELLDIPVGAWLPGRYCTSDVSLDVRLDPPDTHGAGTGGPYGYAIAPQGTVTSDMPDGWSMDHRWDPPGHNDGPGFFFAPVLMVAPDWKFRPSSPAPDLRQWHHVHAFTDGTASRIEVDGKSLGTFPPESGGCGGLLLRVWGGATAFFEHIVVTHPSAATSH